MTPYLFAQRECGRCGKVRPCIWIGDRWFCSPCSGRFLDEWYAVQKETDARADEAWAGTPRTNPAQFPF